MKREHGFDDDIVGSNEARKSETPSSTAVAHPAKRAKTNSAISDRYSPQRAYIIPPGPPEGVDFLSPLSDELLVRILGYLSLPYLLAMSPVSRRFHRLADDSQLWKALYYNRFVLPRAMRIPGFRSSNFTGAFTGTYGGSNTRPATTKTREVTSSRQENWKRQYRLRHNWARGKCAVEELRLGVIDSDGLDDTSRHGGLGYDGERSRMLVKVVDGVAVTADRRRGLRVWELKTRSLVSVASLARRDGKSPAADKGAQEIEDRTAERDMTAQDGYKMKIPVPTSMSVDVTENGLDIAIGFLDGSFDIWQLNLGCRLLTRRFAHAASSSGAAIGIAYSHPFVLTATDSVLVSLYSFEEGRLRTPPGDTIKLVLRPPSLLTSLRSHTSRPPLALSIRKLASVAIASIAYTFSTRQGWSIGIQDLHIQQAVKQSYQCETRDHTGDTGVVLPKVFATRLANSPPIPTGRSPVIVRESLLHDRALLTSAPRSRLNIHHEAGTAFADHHATALHQNENDGGPRTLCYTHPYLLATMPDNTLVLHLCTSNASTLAISAGIRLWGHTSGISDAEITSRGKAVSVSTRGDEMRVWELEGRPAAERGHSVAIRPNMSGQSSNSNSSNINNDDGNDETLYEWDERRNWVGFDDEMVIVLKESRGGQESLMVYDFT